ncbi:MAG: glycosyltransferase, partial [Pseudomonadota bacterium]
LMLEGWYAWHVRRALRAQADKATLIVLILPPVAFALTLGALGRQGRVVGVVHDLYGIMATSSSGWPRRLVAKAIGWVERLVLQRCDRLIALSSSMREVLHRRYAVADERIRVAYPFETLGELEHTSDALAPVLPDGQLHVVYSGALGEKQMPELLLAVFARLVDAHDHIVCHVFSAGPKFDALRQSPTSRHERLRFHPLVAEAHLCELYARSTLQVIPQAPGTGAGAFPSKLPNLIAAGVPIFAICDDDSELAQVIREANAGEVLSSDDPTRIAEGLARSLAAVQDEAREARRQRLCPYVDQHFRVCGLLDKLGVASRIEDP